MMKILLALLAAQCTLMPAGALKDCKQSNDYVKAECGEADKNLKCCTHKQACITVTPHKGDNDLTACSEKRKLSGHKAMKIVLIPMIFGIMDILFVVYMVLKCSIKGNHVTKLCVGAIAVSWPLLLSKMWFFGVWAGFLSLFVAYMSDTDGMPRWVYRLVWAMQIFQVVLIFGPNEAFHVPLFNQSLATKNSDLLTDLLGYTEAACSEFYGGFFEYIDIEKQQTEFNTDALYYGLCTEGWIGFVQTFVMFQALVWIVSSLLSARVFLTDAPRKGQAVTPAKDSDSSPPKKEDENPHFAFRKEDEKDPLRDAADTKEQSLVVEAVETSNTGEVAPAGEA